MGKTDQPLIDPEFSEHLRTQTKEESDLLERLLLRAGRAEQDLVVWDEGNILLDGHHRLRLCNKHNLPYGVLRKSFPSREAALDWAIDNQLARRNLTPEEASYLRGKKYLNARKAVGRPAEEKSGHSDHIISPSLTSEKVAAQTGVAEKTVRRDGEFAEALDTVAASDPGVKAEVLSGKSPLKRKDVVAAAKAPEPARALEEKRKARAGRAEKSPMEVRKTALEALGVAFRCADRLKVYGQVGGLLEQAKKVFYDWRPEN